MKKIYGIFGLIILLVSCEDVGYEIKKFFGFKTGVHVHIDVFVDVTGSIDLKEETPKDSLFIISLINQLQTSDLLEVYFIHARTFSRSEKIYHAGMPEKPGPRNIILDKAREKSIVEFHKIWQKSIDDAHRRGFHRQTDLAGVFQFLKDHTAKSVAHKIVLLSDMLAVNPGKWNFERTPPATTLLDNWQKEKQIPNLGDKNIFVFGCAPLPNMSNEHYLAVRQFWEAFFQRADTRLMAYQYQRESGLIFK